MTEAWTIDPLVWRVLDLATLPVEEPYRATTTVWADRVNWAVVNAEAITAVRANDARGEPDYEATGFNEVDREAPWSLFAWPIDANEQQITNGIHRIIAMRKQGETRTVGLMIGYSRRHDPRSHPAGRAAWLPDLWCPWITSGGRAHVTSRAADPIATHAV